jgi:hypothetical protein
MPSDLAIVLSVKVLRRNTGRVTGHTIMTTSLSTGRHTVGAGALVVALMLPLAA